MVWFLTAEYCRGLLEGRYRSNEPGGASGDELSAPTDSEAELAATAFLESYATTCDECTKDADKRMRVLERFDKRHVLGEPLRKARARTPGGDAFETASVLAEEVEMEEGRPRIRERDAQRERLHDPEAMATGAAFAPYLDDGILDLARRINVGGDFINLLGYDLLVGPEDFAGASDLPLCHLVEAKQQRPAAALYHFPSLSPANCLNPAHLTADCQRRMQRYPSPILDEVPYADEHWLIRTRPHARLKLAAQDIALHKRRSGKRLEQYAVACGKALALAHCRGDRRSTRFEQAMSEQLKANAEALIAAAVDYAELVAEDRRLLIGMLRRER